MEVEGFSVTIENGTVILDKVIEVMVIGMDKCKEDASMIEVMVSWKWISKNESSSDKPSSGSTDVWVVDTWIVISHDKLIGSVSSSISLSISCMSIFVASGPRYGGGLTCGGGCSILCLFC